ncbi:cupin domain-containing protein [Jiangella asiatica]|uniref:Cupin domain-containing protein n=1 Tax=Jiangella asiatica TaxID=2530372 RepID=A0A4R5DA67_9ACTN|nr:cupin domain-containing protein [Jiangella asiatica]TDE07455.1 cupin domain-containing protein [Jiangella asiatica]
MAATPAPDRSGGTVQGGVVRAADVAPATDLAGHPRTAAHRLLRPGTPRSRWLHVTLDVIEFGGGIDPHRHDGVDADHAYFVISGTVRARIGVDYVDAGPDDLLVFPCDVVHGFTVTSRDGAKVLRLGAAADGRTSGNSVFVDE